MGIWIGNEQKDIGEDISSEFSRAGIRNTGFYKLDKIKAGRYLIIRRDESTAFKSSSSFNVNHFLVFETPNLLQELEGIATITSDTTLEEDAVEPMPKSNTRGSSNPITRTADL